MAAYKNIGQLEKAAEEGEQTAQLGLGRAAAKDADAEPPVMVEARREYMRLAES